MSVSNPKIYIDTDVFLSRELDLCEYGWWMGVSLESKMSVDEFSLDLTI